jgi:hypothetical protein
LRVIAGAWLGAFAVLWALLPVLDSRASHVRADLGGAVVAGAAATDADSSDTRVDRCEFCDLLNTWGGSPGVPVGDRMAAAASEVPAARPQDAAIVGVRAHAFARGPPAA